VTGVTLTAVMRTDTAKTHTKPDHESTTVLVADGLAEGLVHAERPSLWARLMARWHPRQLDRALAGGVPPEASTALALRAQELTELERRQSIAGAIRQVIREAREGAPIAPGRIRPDRRRVAAASEELGALAETLAEPGPVAATGVAQAWILLTDGTGPLYNPYSRTSLCAGAARAVRELRPWPV
jgi:hypothetical protein